MCLEPAWLILCNLGCWSIIQMICWCSACASAAIDETRQSYATTQMFHGQKLRETVFKLQVALRYYKTKQQMKPKPPHQRTTHKKGGGDASSKHIRNQVLNALKLHVFFWTILLVFDYVWHCLKLVGPSRVSWLEACTNSCLHAFRLRWHFEPKLGHWPVLFAHLQHRGMEPPDYISRGDMNTLDWF